MNHIDLETKHEPHYSCLKYLPKPKRKHFSLVAYCPHCGELYTCGFRLYVPYSIRCGGYYFWKKLEKENK